AETDDEIAADRHAGHALTATLQHVAVELDRIQSLHAFEYGIAARLRGNVQIFAYFRQIAHGVEQVVAHVAREVSDELDAFDAGRVVDAQQQIGQPFAPAVAVVERITIDGLAEQGDFLAALGGKLANFRSDKRRWPALLRTAHTRHDAIGAELVAAHRSTHIRQ